MSAPIQLFDPASCSYTYLLYDEATREAAIIDPVEDQLARGSRGAVRPRPEAGLGAGDPYPCRPHHQCGAARRAHGRAHGGASGCGIGTAAVQLEDGQVLRFGGEQIKALHTPGHTAGSMSYLWRDHVFTGDSLLINGCGRTDFQSGSAAGALSQPDRSALALARIHDGVAGP
jgi:glyoxylase-like metal-dependent hydrolase (beta-lactamase superfamily II)